MPAIFMASFTMQPVRLETPPDLDALPDRLHRIVAPWAARQPDALALTDADAALSYAQLEQAIRETAARLREAGVRAGDRVLLAGENGVALAVLILALGALDAWACPANARLSAREIGNILEHSGARRALYLGAQSPEAVAHAAAHSAADTDWPWLGSFGLGPLNEQCRPEATSPSSTEQVAALIYTSGTSGDPKGVMLTHCNLLFIGDNGRRLRRLVPQDVVYGVLPLSHVYGLSALLVAALHSGATLRLVPRFAPDALARALAEEGVTVLHGVPAMYARLLDWARQGGHRLTAPRLRIAQLGGAPMTQPLKDDFERAFGLTLHNGYGLTESSPSISQTRLDAPRRDCSVGPPIPGVAVRIIGADGHEVAPGAVGELQVRGPNVMKGYYRNPGLTRETVTAEGWLKTGDLARQGADGALFLVGRSKELIIRSGFNVYPVEVEQALNAHPQVVQSAVVGRSAGANEEVVAFVEAAAGCGLTAEVLAAHLRGCLAPYKLPSEIVFLEQLPASATGKILKNALKERAAARPAHELEKP